MTSLRSALSASAGGSGSWKVKLSAVSERSASHGETTPASAGGALRAAPPQRTIQ